MSCEFNLSSKPLLLLKMTSWVFVLLVVTWNLSFFKEPWSQSRQDAFVSFQLGLAADLVWEEEVRQ